MPCLLFAMTHKVLPCTLVITGTNNSYQLATNSPLAKLYSSSTLERHHLNQALIILNLDGHRILDTLSPSEYSHVLAVIEHAILATDLAVHFSHLARLNRWVRVVNKIQQTTMVSLKCVPN